ncbi:hypothetical protein ACFYV5_16060 [Streptomyces sp. NPDC003035]|uniref:hypothetical protein n=1 Tax=Streptomyces sp. NPDC003035 TaxID=3364676 RepID=UPI0036738CCD
MTSARRAQTALHLLLVWATMTAVVPTLGFGLLAATWGGGGGAALLLIALGAVPAVGLLAAAGTPARTVVPLCRALPQRLGWAALVFALGTFGVGAGLVAYDQGVGLGSAATRLALTGVPYAVAAAFFVPNRWVRLGAVATLAAAVAYGGFLGPAEARERRQEAEIFRYRHHTELLYVGADPPGMRLARATSGPAYFTVEYRGVREDTFAYVALTLRPVLTPTLRCPEILANGVACTVDAHGELRTVQDVPRAVTLTRRVGNAEAEVTSQTLDEAGLRRLLNTLRPLSDAELERLMREKKIDHGT